jgi:putative transposase
MRFAFIRRHAGEFSVAWMCQVLDVSLSGYYAWLRRPESQRSRDDRRFLIEIRAIHRRVAAPMAAHGSTVSCASAGTTAAGTVLRA